MLENNIWGSDLVYQEEKIIGSWRFCQKLWSIANFLVNKLPTNKLRKIKNEDLKLDDQNLVNQWIISRLTSLQKDYFNHLEKSNWGINLITNKLVKFAWENLSNDYLELIKISPWNENEINTLLFVYQQLLIMLHPVIPFITEFIYQELTQRKILEEGFERLDKEIAVNKIWQVDCLIVLMSGVRSLQKKGNINDFCLELMPEWREEFDFSFDFNHFLLPLTKCHISLLERGEKSNFSSSIDLQPFGVLWYQEKISHEELMKKLDFYEKECQRINNLLANNNFLQKAPQTLIGEEKKN